MDTVDTTKNGWTGQYFRNDWLNNNPLIASIQGYPYQVRGTDPASSKASLDWAASGMQSSPTTPAGESTSPCDHVPDWLKPYTICGITSGATTGPAGAFRAFGIGATGVFVGLAFLVIGLLVLLFGTDSGRKVVKSVAA